MMTYLQNKRWQVPGNARAFDSSLEEWNSQESYISFNDIISLTIDGRNFLNCILEEDYIKAKEFLVLSLLSVKYPNKATKDVKLFLYPYRIIFKLILNHGFINIEDFTTKIPYISNLNDIENYNTVRGEYYEKWKAWQISSLAKLQILKIEGAKVYIDKSCNNFICKLIEPLSFESMFYEEDEDQSQSSYFYKKAYKYYARNINLAKEVIKENNYSCFFNDNHLTFKTNTLNNYVEAHHVIFLSKSLSFPKHNLDCKENIICLCPNCHRKIHLAVNEEKLSLLQTIEEKLHICSKFAISFENLKEIYFS